MMKSSLRGPVSGSEKPAGFDIGNYQPMSVAGQLRGAILHRIKARLPLLPEIDGREGVKDDVLRTLLSGAHAYLVSEEGTGKTRLSRALTNLLPPIPFIRGCPYHDDPKWPRELLCPRCQSKQHPVEEFGLDFLPGNRRFSRIQGNEYTNEAKLLGLKDIQSIAHGRSIADPEAFTGTGIFRANRGILFVDEMPAIRTKIQVLFHPLLEEGMVVLEEYNWQYPLDMLFIATGNPAGFSHVNDIPRPLLDRLELIYMDLPDEAVEKKIILSERFNGQNSSLSGPEPEQPRYFTPQDIARRAAVPWWIVDVINKAVRYSRICPFVEKRPSIRATIRALDHTYASVEIEDRQVAGVRHAFYGMRLALRGRIGLRADLIDFEEPRKAMTLAGKLTEDFIWNVFEDIAKDPVILGEWDRKKAGTELDRLLTGNIDLESGRLADSLLAGFAELPALLEKMRKMGIEKMGLNPGAETEAGLYRTGDTRIREELNYSAIEMLANICVHAKTLSDSHTNRLFIASEYV